MSAFVRRRELDGRFARRTRLARLIRGLIWGGRLLTGGAIALIAWAIRLVIASARWSPEISMSIEIEGVTPQRAWMELIDLERRAGWSRLHHAVEPLRGRSGCRVRWSERPRSLPIISPIVGLLAWLPLSIAIGSDLRRLRRELRAERARRS